MLLISGMRSVDEKKLLSSGTEDFSVHLEWTKHKLVYSCSLLHDSTLRVRYDTRKHKQPFDFWCHHEKFVVNSKRNTSSLIEMSCSKLLELDLVLYM